MHIVRRSLVLGALVGFSLVACGSDDGDDGGGGSASCNSVCSCVVSAGGDNASCQQECTDTVNAGGNQKASCEAKVDGFGFPQCKSKCAGFPTS